MDDRLLFEPTLIYIYVSLCTETPYVQKRDESKNLRADIICVYTYKSKFIN